MERSDSSDLTYRTLSSGGGFYIGGLDMDFVELIAATLMNCEDPDRAVSALTRALTDSDVAPHDLGQVGVDCTFVEFLRRRLPKDAGRIEVLCHMGAAWVKGYRSARLNESWELVVSVPAGMQLPEGVRRTTGETLIQLVTEAKRRVRIVAPFVDETGIGYMTDAIAAATVRGTKVSILSPSRSIRGEQALRCLREQIRATGNIENLELVSLNAGVPWAHLKVLVSDSSAAYIGSANLTGAGLGGANIELGLLVRGSQVTTIGLVVDLIQRISHR